MKIIIAQLTAWRYCYLKICMLWAQKNHQCCVTNCLHSYILYLANDSWTRTSVTNLISSIYINLSIIITFINKVRWPLPKFAECSWPWKMLNTFLWPWGADSILQCRPSRSTSSEWFHFFHWLAPVKQVTWLPFKVFSKLFKRSTECFLSRGS